MQQPAIARAQRANERAMGWMDRAGAMPRVTAQNRARGSTLGVVAELAKMLRPRWNDGNRTPKTLMPGILWRSSGSASCSGLCPERRPLTSVLGRCYWLSGGLRGENRKLSQQQFHQHPLWCGAPAPSAPGDGGTGDGRPATRTSQEAKGAKHAVLQILYSTSYLPSRTSGCPPACHPSHLGNSSGDGPGSKRPGSPSFPDHMTIDSARKRFPPWPSHLASSSNLSAGRKKEGKKRPETHAPCFNVDASALSQFLPF
ncbi:hypothetical protein B0T26DRAFT_60725 [Lasiosphaeria miniovina]|uniref:Uncharacterized protein n=1 Tax=Lasiosphaeria miniovina TaxID=1954250 RepID=A0AA40EE82_9PEZI|nr:uncharacterized protein B0T26DRAFT_60725 [Lasiosphaeria miniovina]KAK0734226.1 hypothetical protein B0T26DRAFT_60725 [Lasiosphaeria miniovina]